MRTLIELLHILVGLTTAAFISAAAAWAYPLGRDVIWWCGAGAMLATLVMGVKPLRRARAADRKR